MANLTTPNLSRYLQDPRSKLYASMIEAGSSAAPVQSWQEGLARALQAPIGAYMQRQAMGEYEQRQADAEQKKREALAALMGEGGFKQGMDILSQNPETSDLALSSALAQAVKGGAKLRYEQDAQGNWIALPETMPTSGKIEPIQTGIMGKKKGETDLEFYQRDPEGFRKYKLSGQLPRQFTPTDAKAAFDLEIKKKIMAGTATPEERAALGGGKTAQRMPSSALKLQQDEIDAIGTASAISSDLGEIKRQVDTGELQLGPGKNLANAALNLAGMSTAGSKKFASFKATLEKLRNDSLRLNKGVQTEGDSVRAWNEIIANINDPGLVSDRLGEVIRINERAKTLRSMNIDNIRNNYGLEPIDLSTYNNLPAALGKTKPGGVMPPKTGTVKAGTAPGSGGGWGIRRLP